MNKKSLSKDEKANANNDNKNSLVYMDLLIPEIMNLLMKNNKINILCFFNKILLSTKKYKINPIIWLKISQSVRDIGELEIYEYLLKNLVLLYPKNHTILLRLAEIHANNRDIELSHQFLLIGEATGSPYLAYKNFGFECDWNISHGKTLNAILSDKSRILEFGAIALRHLDSMSEEERDCYINACKDILINLNYILSTSNGTKCKRILQNLLRMRLLVYVDKVDDKYKSREVKNEIELIKTRINKISTVINVAFYNTFERSVKDYFYGIINNQVGEVDAEHGKIIEIAIPTVFFSRKKEEKSTYESVRNFYVNLIVLLSNSNKYVLVPFHQYNWRNYRRRLANSLVICYHCVAKDNNTLVIQESQIPERCSFDTRGFAGFSSVSKNLDIIDSKLSIFDDNFIAKRYLAISNSYRSNNISKYPQHHASFVCQKDFVFVPLQIPTDIVSQLADISTIDLLKYAASKANDNIMLVVKPHPYNNSSDITKYLKSQENNPNIVITETSIHEILAHEHCRAVLTTNSGVGFEAFFYNKPVFVTGLCDYIYGVNEYIKAKSNIDKIFDPSFHPCAKTNLQERFVVFYNDLYTYHDSLDNRISILEMINSKLDNIKRL